MENSISRKLYWEGVPKEISDFVDLRKKIQNFKDTEPIKILKLYYSEGKNNPFVFGNTTYKRFVPQINKDKIEGRIGIFSTAACLETITLYFKEIYKNEKTDKGKINKAWVEELINNNTRKLLTEFIIKGLNDEFYTSDEAGVTMKCGDLAQVTTLTRLGKCFIEIDKNKDDGIFISDLEGDNTLRKSFFNIIDNCIKNLDNHLKTDEEKLNTHPFIFYKYLQFFKALEGLKAETLTDVDNRQNPLKMIKRSDGKKIFNYYFDQIYFWAKYELYRQTDLNLSGDTALYDAKRLIYSLLIVSLENKFSSDLARKKALTVIFETQRKNSNEIWPTGQLIPLCKGNQMSVSSIQSAIDLLECDEISSALREFVPELKKIYDFCVRTMQKFNDDIQGWYPDDQRDKTTNSWTTALVLYFIKKFCKFLSYCVSEKAKDEFHLNYLKPTITWENLYDSTAVKAKLRLMLHNSLPKELNKKNTTAILFGPPGTGKSTYARALATKLNWEYLELTPGDFYSGGENNILIKINKIFENLLHLEKTVVFIDEIDDLVRNRKPETKEQDAKAQLTPFDPRTLYVNTLLPRFQELRDRRNILLIMATNHFEGVDPAIARIGRIDLLIPVGPMSVHGRLKLFYQHMEVKENEKLKKNFSGLSVQKRTSVLNTYLKKTENAEYTHITIFIEKLVEIFKENNDLEKTISHANKIVSDEEEKIKEFINSEQNNDLKKIRPYYEQSDFIDIAYLNTYLNGKKKASNYIKLFMLIDEQINDINNMKEKQDYSSLRESLQTWNKINNMIQKTFPKEEYRSLITPFYDDIELLYTKVGAEFKKAKDELTKAKEELCKVEAEPEDSKNKKAAAISLIENRKNSIKDFKESIKISYDLIHDIIYNREVI